MRYKPPTSKYRVSECGVLRTLGRYGSLDAASERANVLADANPGRRYQIQDMHARPVKIIATFTRPKG